MTWTDISEVEKVERYRISTFDFEFYIDVDVTVYQYRVSIYLPFPELGPDRRRSR